MLPLSVPSRRRRLSLLAAAGALLLAACSVDSTESPLAPSLSISESSSGAGELDPALGALLKSSGFTGHVGSSLTARLGRPVNNALADVGRLLFFDPELGLNNDNSCAGCHNPRNGFGDSQSIAIGIQNNGVVGPGRSGPRNQRRTPTLTNIAFYPALMWNSRFHANTGNPFDRSRGFTFPLPEGSTLSDLPHLLNAQAFIPPTERVEMAGFAFPGNNDDIRGEVVRRINATAGYRARFARLFPPVAAGAPLTYTNLAAAIAEFQFSLTFANAPIDRYARGERAALSANEKRGAIIFFGKGKCVACHAVRGYANEMFSDFKQHVIAVPQVVPAVTNVAFDGPGGNEDFGLAQITGKEGDRYAFRSSPLRNVSLQTTFMHNGAFTRLEDAIRHHLDPVASAMGYSPAAARVAADLRGPVGPVLPMLRRLDPLLQKPTTLSNQELDDLIRFVRVGLLDPRATRLTSLIPSALPSGRRVHRFQ